MTRANDPLPGACKPNDCSLREAVLAANGRPGGDKIALPARKRPYKLTRANPGGGPEGAAMTGDLDVVGGKLTIAARAGSATIRQQQPDRLFETFAGAPLTLRALKLTGGDSLSALIEDGGAILAGARLVVVRCSLTGNRGDDGGAIDFGFEGVLKMRRSSVTDNSSADDAGAIRLAEGANLITGSNISDNRALGTSSPEGGAIDMDDGGNLTVRNSTLAQNRTLDHGGAISHEAGVLRVSGSTISGNFAEDGGGGLWASGLGTTAVVTNSTLAGNTTDQIGGGIAANDKSQVSLNAVTVARNIADADAGGIVGDFGGGLRQELNGDIDAENSIVALNLIGGPGNTTRNDCADDGDPLDSLGGNVYSENVYCSGFTGPGDKLRANPRIGKLRRNGGPTKTIELRKGSAALGNARKDTAPKRDQRNRKRDSNPDSGAFERGA